MNVLIEKAKTGTDNLVIEINGVRHPVYSRYDPVKDGERFYSENITGGGDFFIIIGLGLGYHIRPFIGNQTVKRIVVIEPLELIYKKVSDFVPVREVAASKKVEIFSGESALRFISSLAGMYDYLFFDRLRVLCYPPMKRVPGSEYGEIEKAVKYGLDALVEDSLTIGKFARLWLRNFILNFNSVKKIRLVSSLFGMASGSAVVTGAGPSLDRALPGIKAGRSSFFLIATDASVKPLMRTGITPDLIVTIDPQAHVRLHFDGLDRASLGRIPAVINLLSYPAAFDIFYRKYFYFSRHPTTSLFDTDFLKKQNVIMNYRSVSSLAYRIAVEMGFREIYLSGLDFSYPGLRAYAGKSFFYDFGTLRWERLCPAQTFECKLILRGSKKIECPGGEPLYTSHNLIGYHMELENAVSEAGNREKVTTRKWKASGIPIKGAGDVEEAPLNTVPKIAEKGDVSMDVPFSLPSAERAGFFNSDPAWADILHSIAATLALRNRIYRGVARRDDAFKSSVRYVSDKFIKK